MESFSRMLNAQMILLVYLAVGMYSMKAGLIDQETKKKLVDIILKITLPCMIFNSFNKPLTTEVLIQTALILVVAVSISILSFLLGKVIFRIFRNAYGVGCIWKRRSFCRIHLYHSQPYLHVDRGPVHVHHR